MQVCNTKNLVAETCGQWGGLGVKGCCNSYFPRPRNVLPENMNDKMDTFDTDVI